MTHSWVSVCSLKTTTPEEMKENWVLVIRAIWLSNSSLGGTVSSWRPLGGLLTACGRLLFIRFQTNASVKGLLHCPLLTILACLQTETMSPFSLNRPSGHLREDQSWEWGWGEQSGRRRRGRCGFSKVSLSMVSERLEIYSKCLFWLEKQQ